MAARSVVRMDFSWVSMDGSLAETPLGRHPVRVRDYGPAVATSRVCQHVQPECDDVPVDRPKRAAR